MKKKVISILMMSILILTGCSGKGVSSTSKSNTDSTNKASASSDIRASENSKSSVTTAERVQVNIDFKELKPGTVPQLSVKQKTEVNTKLNSTVNDLSKTLKSIQDAQDIDLSSVN